MPYRTRTEAFLAGARTLLPLTPGVIPFGLVAGVMATEMGLSPGMTMAMTLIFYSGSAQMAALQLLHNDVVPVAIVLTALIINLRFVMYSASLAPYLHQLPRRWTWPLSYMLSDQSYAICILKFSEGRLGAFGHFYYAGTAVAMWLAWELSVLAGVLLGAGVPSSWSLSFAIPLSFLALLVPAIRNRASLASAVVSGSVAVLAIDLPYNLGLVTASIVGIVVGVSISNVRRRAEQGDATMGTAGDGQ
ncbi:MAG: AzlC family ABC transporter permease [Pseudomonas sp.]